jgi:chromate transporter
MNFWDIARVFLRTGATSFGGWATTSLLLEKELVTKRKLLTEHQIKGAATYAQILPGATQVAIVSNVGYQLRGFFGALTATVFYLLPAISLITLFAMLYFQFATDSSRLDEHLDGLVAALSGIILANAYKIGGKHVSKGWLWVLVGVAFLANAWLDVNALVIIIGFGVTGLILSWTRLRKAVR